MYKKTKLTLTALSMLALYGCGGSNNSDNTSVGLVVDGGAPPTLNVEALNLGIDGVTTTTEMVNDVVEWNVIFPEDKRGFGIDAEDFYDIDLLAGISDPDTENLRIQAVRFIWLDGPDCANTTVDAVNFPDLCTPFLAEVGLEPGDAATPSEARVIREMQNLPVVTQERFGFELRQSDLRVTPRNFAPLLNTDQTAKLGITYQVTDGESILERRLIATVVGISAAPTFIETNADGSPRLDNNGDMIPVTIDRQLASEKSDGITIDVVEGLFDQDIFDAQQFAREIGDLEAFYSFNGQRPEANVYQPEALQVTNLMVTTSDGSEIDIPEGFTTLINRVDPITRILSSSNLIIQPSVFQDQLSFGDSLDLVVSINLTDGDNETLREIPITILGADLTNPPIFFDDLTESINTTDTPTGFSLLDGAIELDAEQMSVVGLMPADGTEDTFGVFINDLSIVVDPIYFSSLLPDESKVLSYTYRLSDGLLESEERRIDITVNGTSANLAARGMQSDPGLESGSIDNSAWRFQTNPNSAATPENLLISDVVSHTGDYSLSSLENGMLATYGVEGIQQNQLEEGNLFYVNFFTQVSQFPWNAITILLNNGDNFSLSDSVLNERLNGSLGVSNQWVERTGTFVAPEFFNPNVDESASLSVLLDQDSALDDLSIVKINPNFTTRILIPNGQFTSPSAQGWSLTGGSLEVTLDANRATNPNGNDYGLEIMNNTTETQQLMLDPSFFAQGAIKNGMRYIIQFDMRTPSYLDATGAIPIDIGVHEVGGATFSKRVDFAVRSPTLWTRYYMHIDTNSDSVFFGGPINNDLNFDWENATVQPVLFVRPGDHLQIDNVAMYPVPKH